jgi:TetR/AcrR family transcriptional repressor of bet genes
MPRPSNSDQRRAQIIDAMMVVLARHGYERASIQAIAAQAGLSAGLLHYHFKSKQEILLATADELERRMRARYDAFLSKIGPRATARDMLHAFIRAHVAKQDASPEAVACWVALAAEAVHLDEVRALYARIIAADSAQLDALLTLCGAHEPTRRRHIAAAILASIQGAYQLAAAAPGATLDGWAEPTIIDLTDRLLST